MNRKNIDKLITQALAIEEEEAKDAGSIGFMARALTQATMPHKQTPDLFFTRKNGNLSLAIIAHPSLGLPYGSYPRLLLSWMTTEAVKKKSPVLELGPSLSCFMSDIGLIPTGGRWGTIGRLRDQMRRLFSSTVSCAYTDEHQDTGVGFRITKEYKLWWDPKSPDQIPLWKSTVTLSKDFFEEIIERPVPVDMRALKALKRSPMALDTYCWLTYRLSYLRKPTEIPWQALQMQFGASYSSDTPQGLINFKWNFLKHLRAVCLVYQQANIEEGKHGLILKPSKPHVARIKEWEKKTPDLEAPPLLPPDVIKERLARLPSVQESVPVKPVPVPAPVSRSRRIFLKPETYEKAKEAAPRMDIYALESEWLRWHEGSADIPDDPDGAFIGFCKKKALK